MPRRPDRIARKLRSIRGLLFFNAFIWFCLGTFLVIEMAAFNNTLSIVLVGFFMYMNAAVMLVSGILLPRRKPWIYPLVLLFLVANIMLILADQVGVMDVFTLLLDLVILIMLISVSRAYLRKP